MNYIPRWDGESAMVVLNIIETVEQYKNRIERSLAIIDESSTIREIAENTTIPGWPALLSESINELRDISEIIEEEQHKYRIFPLKRDIFAAFFHTPLKKVKVVILGQDPYHQSIVIGGKDTPRSVGMSFSVRRDDSIPCSLKNIYKELANTVRGFHTPNHGDLSQWAMQGVLMLNSCLTVREGKAGSHGHIWLGVINRVFRMIAEENPYCIFILWGREAQKLKPMIGDRSVILEAPHPSGFSATKGFFGCNHFNIANEILVKQGKVAINWNLTPVSTLMVSNNAHPVKASQRLQKKIEEPVPIKKEEQEIPLIPCLF